MPFEERFIQDAICDPNRLQTLLNKLGKQWEFGENDVVNQEINFSGGRIDVLATFDQRKNIVIIESKAEPAGIEALAQLEGYLRKWPELLRDLKAAGTEIACDDTYSPQGILLAEKFINIQKTPENVALIEFNLDPGGPFKVVDPANTPRLVDPEPNVRRKISGLYTLQYHLALMSKTNEATQQLFKKLADCFLKDDDPRRSWLYRNPKCQHIRVDYKGTYVLHLWPRSDGFAVGYEHSGQQHFRKFTNTRYEISEDQLQHEVGDVLIQVERKRPPEACDDFWSHAQL